MNDLGEQRGVVNFEMGSMISRSTSVGPVKLLLAFIKLPVMELVVYVAQCRSTTLSNSTVQFYARNPCAVRGAISTYSIFCESFIPFSLPSISLLRCLGFSSYYGPCGRGDMLPHLSTFVRDLKFRERPSCRLLVGE